MYHLHDTPTFSNRKKNISKIPQASMNFLGLRLSLYTSFFCRIFIYNNFPLAKLFFSISLLLFSFLHYGNTIKDQLSPHKTFTRFYVYSDYLNLQSSLVSINIFLLQFLLFSFLLSLYCFFFSQYFIFNVLPSTLILSHCSCCLRCLYQFFVPAKIFNAIFFPLLYFLCLYLSYFTFYILLKEFYPLYLYFFGTILFTSIIFNVFFSYFSVVS